MDLTKLDFLQEAVAAIRLAETPQQSGRADDFRDSAVQIAIASALVDIALGLRAPFVTPKPATFISIIYVATGNTVLGLKSDGTVWRSANATPLVWTPA